MVISGKFHPKKLYELFKFWEKKISIPEWGLRFGLKIAKTTILGCRTEFFFFFVEKKVDRSVFWGEIYRRLP